MLKTLALAFLFAAAVPLSLSVPDVALAASHEHEDHDHAHPDHSGHVSEADGMRAVHAWTRASHKGDNALVFVTLQNRSHHLFTIKGGHSGKAKSVELVGFMMKDGNDLYVPIAEMPIKAGQEMELAPKSLALRLNDLKDDLHKGESFEMGLDFVKDGKAVDIHVNVEVGASNATRHSHAGHMHE
ncbi:copper chaperone PCu(A)C [uncultured Cohaesibacter sp.]|uniref:copper chaperone PCu(A)C n=1 Tax=uncultured Cohaesibacter sp. TaxID=1002546 RepID=UPI00292E220C|nr:copper chaperone PCu(A)C [uncultured Cohaesibacter sp.]